MKDRPEQHYKKVWIESEKDLPREEDDYYVHEKHTPDFALNNYYFDQETEDEYHSWINNLDWYLQPYTPASEKVIEQQEAEEILDRIHNIERMSACMEDSYVLKRTAIKAMQEYAQQGFKDGLSYQSPGSKEQKADSDKFAL